MRKSMMLFLFLVIVLQTQLAKSQETDCPTALGNLNVCAASVTPRLPGESPSQPGPECCGALRAVPHDCVCNTISIASRLPALCNLPAISCGQN